MLYAGGMRLTGLSPIADRRSRVLILGSAESHLAAPKGVLRFFRESILEAGRPRLGIGDPDDLSRQEEDAP